MTICFDNCISSYENYIGPFLANGYRVDKFDLDTGTFLLYKRDFKITLNVGSEGCNFEVTGSIKFAHQELFDSINQLATVADNFC
ncbi:hypothetical protein L1D14_10810 [Vibrio tubiashii]|uniref:hypothetical protein n=1 Tax=Vibrio tubiashii TaxID=29498 RepID=UPI001EFD4A1F|nr:hypothetical protein [Vibrio tubiashii]MCG9576729.1 hypothetical protein [Vibrio tubiashii]